MAKQASVTLDLLRSWRFDFTATISKMFSKMTIGQLMESTATLMMNAKRTSREVLGTEKNGPASQLSDVALILV